MVLQVRILILSVEYWLLNIDIDNIEYQDIDTIININWCEGLWNMVLQFQILNIAEIYKFEHQDIEHCKMSKSIYWKYQ